MTASGRGLDPNIVRAPRATAQARGAAGEDLAVRFLTAQGLRIVARNIRCRGGEIDLVALDGTCLVFIEVRLRVSARFGGAAASITPAKQRRILLAARWWLAGAGRAHAARPMRIDALLLTSLADDAIEWIRNAIAADGW